MFGINSTKQVGQIIEGWTNYTLGRENELSESRMQICRSCPLYNSKTDRCDSSKCMNPETGEVKQYPDDGFICGCNCIMSAKSRSISSHCVLGKW